MEISKKFTFEASHQLPNELCYGKCRRLHGHSYKLFVYVQGDVNDKGWVCNFSIISKFVDENVIDKLDHYHLNDVLPDMITTAENIAQWILEQIQKPIEQYTGAKVSRIVLYETEKCSVELKV